MSTLTFDTYKFIKTLTTTGLPEVQAEAISSAVRNAYDGSEVANRNDLREMELRFAADLKQVKLELGADIKEVKLELSADIKEVKGEMTLLKWMLGLIVAGTATLILKSFF